MIQNIIRLSKTFDFLKEYKGISARRHFSGEGSEVHQGRACKGGRGEWGPRGGAPYVRKVFNIFKKSMKIYNFLIILIENLGKNFDKFRNLHFYGVWRAEPLKLANLLNTYSINQWKPPIFWKFAWIMKEFLIRCKFL